MVDRHDIPLLALACGLAVVIEIAMDPSDDMLPVAGMVLAALIVTVRFFWAEVREEGSFHLRSPRSRRRRAARRKATTES